MNKKVFLNFVNVTYLSHVNKVLKKITKNCIQDFLTIELFVYLNSTLTVPPSFPEIKSSQAYMLILGIS